MADETVSPESSARRAHGALKADILQVLLHASGPMSARQIRAGLDTTTSTPALANVLTVLERLRRAGEVDRLDSEDGELRFVATREESEETAHSMLDSLLRSHDRDGALLSFAGSLDDQDLAVLRRAVAPDETGQG